jgi:hypothetical protein
MVSKEIKVNHTTRIIVAVVSVFLGIAGLDHGIFEILQGNKPTNSLIIQAIGPEQNLWGTEEAFTIVPNFLATGILAVSVSLAIIVWAVGFVHRKYGSTILGLLFIALFLTGGGIAAQILFAPFTWAAARRINRPLTGWRKVLPEGIRRGLAHIWPVTLIIGCLSLLIGIFIAITGFVPGTPDDDRILAICWSFVFGGGLGMFLLSFLAGFAKDLQRPMEGTG